MSLDGAVGDGPLCKLCGTPPGRELPTPEGRAHLPGSCPLSALQSPAAVPTWRTTFLQVEDGSLDSRKTKWISPDSNAPRGHHLGRALARQNTRPDMSILIKDVTHTRPLEKENEAQPISRPGHAAPRHASSQAGSRLPAKAMGRRHAAKAGAELFAYTVPVRG